MGSGYSPKRTGLEAFAKTFRGLQAGLDAVNQRISALGIQVDKTNGKLIISAGRSLEVDGDCLITGNLSVPNGSITNAALQNPVVAAVAHADTNNFSIPNIPIVTKLTTTVNVPTGFSQALVFAVSELSAYNGSPGASSIYLDTHVNGLPSTSQSQMSASAPVNWYAFISVTNTKLLTGLGSSFPITSLIGADWVWPANTFNILNLNAQVIFLR